MRLSDNSDTGNHQTHLEYSLHDLIGFHRSLQCEILRVFQDAMKLNER
jgi:hypothetical protein